SRNEDKFSGMYLENTFLSIPKLIPHVLPHLKYFTFLCHQIWNSEQAITQIVNTPILFLSGKLDELVPSIHMKKLYEINLTSRSVKQLNSNNISYKEFSHGTHNDTCIQPYYFDFVIIITVYIRRKFVKPPPEFKDIPTISPIQLIKTLISGRPHDEVQKVMEAAHNQYGIIWYVVRWGIHISKLEYVKEFLTEPIDNVPKITYSPDSAVSKFLGVGLFTSNDETWKVHRNISAKAFNKALSPKIIGECGIDSVKLIEKWENTPMDTFLLMQRITLQALGKVAFGYDFQCLKNWEEQPEFIETYHSIMNHVMAPRTFFFPFLDKLPLNSNIRYRMLKAAENEDYTWSARSLRDEIVILFVAGHDTTAHSLSVVFYYLGRYLDIQEKAREEVVRIIGKDLVIPTSDQLKELKYVNAIIKEALRLYPSLTTAPPRIIQRDFQFDNFLIPKGTYLQVNYWQIHHNPEIYPRPYEFIPERWLDNHPMSLNANQEKRHAFSWLPFSAGPRNW
ncbi:15310_t:CDS:10, partial [Entrophospora sp. SA101]